MVNKLPALLLWVADGYVDNDTFNDHSANHESGGGDAIKLDDLATPDDNTDLNATTTEHGLLRKLDNNSSNFLNGQGNWASPSAGADSYEVKVSVDDTTPDFIEDKLVAGSNITLTTNNPGGNETLTIASTGGGGGLTWNDIDGYSLTADVVTKANVAYVHVWDNISTKTTTLTNPNTWYDINFNNACNVQVATNISCTNDGVFTFDVAGDYLITLKMKMDVPAAGRWDIVWRDGDDNNALGLLQIFSTDVDSTWSSYSWVMVMTAAETGTFAVFRNTANTDTTFELYDYAIDVKRLGD